MKSFLIKLGKSFNLLKNEGPIKGLKKILGYFFVFIKSLFILEKGDILFISSGVGDSARYRTRNVAEELSLHGFKCSVTVQDNLALPRLAHNFKIFIFHKTLITPRVKKMVAKIKEQGKEIIFDADDLLFDPQFIQKTDYYQKINSLEKDLYAKGLGGEFVDDDYVKVCTATTTYLADKFREKGKEVFIVPNKLSNKDLKMIESIKSKSPSSPLSKIKIGYFSGTKSHDRDFATVAETLLEIMRKYPNVELILAGPLEISEKFSEFSDRIKKLPFANRKKHFENISSADINLAPLEIGDPFCESKSELKFFEAGILGVPTIAAATRTFRGAIVDGEDGFLAVTSEQWRDKMEKLVSDDDFRLKMGQKARKKTLKDYTNKNSHNEEYYNYLKSKL
jgi:O-antigen biosynthesis protein